MCVTIRYWFSCGHPATDRYRIGLCESPSSANCHIQDLNRRIAIPGRRCSCPIDPSIKVPPFHGNVNPEKGIVSKEVYERYNVWHDAVVQAMALQWNKNIERFDRDTEEFAEVWYIPARCFIDHGFQTLDPFRPKDSALEVSPYSTSPPQSPTIVRPSPRSGHVFKRVVRSRRAISPCCQAQRRAGCVFSYRAEGRDYRRGGRILDNRCQALD